MIGWCKWRIYIYIILYLLANTTAFSEPMYHCLPVQHNQRRLQPWHFRVATPIGFHSHYFHALSTGSFIATDKTNQNLGFVSTSTFRMAAGFLLYRAVTTVITDCWWNWFCQEMVGCTLFLTLHEGGLVIIHNRVPWLLVHISQAYLLDIDRKISWVDNTTGKIMFHSNGLLSNRYSEGILNKSFSDNLHWTIQYLW